MRLLTVTEASEFLGVSTFTLRMWEKKGKLIPNIRVGNRKDRLYEESVLIDIKENMEWKGKIYNSK